MYTLRPAGPADEALLFQLYASTREEELQLTGWDDAQREAFCRQQFDAQHRWYHEQYTDATFDVVSDGDKEVGRLYVARWPAEIRIVDITLLPEHRGRGLGTAILTDLIAEADAARLAVTAHVERFNPARGLYYRLGFRQKSETELHLLLSRPPARVA